MVKREACAKKPLINDDDLDENENEDDDCDDNDDNSDVDDNDDIDDNDDDDDVSPDRVKSLPGLLKKHNVYFGKFIISRK